MASGTIPIYGYDTGITETFILRSIGRVTNAGNAIYTYVVLDKPVVSNQRWASITLVATPVCYTITGTDTISVQSNDCTTVGISHNMIYFTFPCNSVTAQKLYYIEGSVSITFQ